MTKPNAEVGFAFSTKDRVHLTLRSLASVNTDGGFDLIWVDGSDTPEGRALPESIRLHNCLLAEAHYDFKGGPDNAIRLGLRRPLHLGYRYCGLIENAVEFRPGWYAKLMQLFELGSRDGLRVGAATVRTIESRVPIPTAQYVMMWNVGAGMVLFTREAARIVLATYGHPTAQKLHTFYADKVGVDLKDRWELWMDAPDRGLGCDWAYAMQLHRYGLYSLGSVPSRAFDMDFDLETAFRTSYARRPAKISQAHNQRWSKLTGAPSQMGIVPTVKRNAMFVSDSVRSAVLWAQKRNKWVRRIAHPARSARSLRRKVAADRTSRLWPRLGNEPAVVMQLRGNPGERARK